MSRRPFYTPCFRCENKDTLERWKHTCGGFLSIDEYGYVECDECHSRGRVIEWRNACSSCRSGYNEYKKDDMSMAKMFIILTICQEMKVWDVDFTARLFRSVLNMFD